MCYKPIKDIVGLTDPACNFVFVIKLVCSRVKPYNDDSIHSLSKQNILIFLFNDIDI